METEGSCAEPEEAAEVMAGSSTESGEGVEASLAVEIEKAEIYTDMLLEAANGAVYLFHNLPLSMVEKASTDHSYCELLLYIAFKQGMVPQTGNKYYNSDWEKMFSDCQPPDAVVNTMEDSQSSTNDADKAADNGTVLDLDELKSPPKKKMLLVQEDKPELQMEVISTNPALENLFSKMSPFKNKIADIPTSERKSRRQLKLSDGLLINPASPENPSNGESCTVVISNLKETMVKKDFIDHINSQMKLFEIIKEGEESVIQCSEFNNIDNSVEVVFRSAEDAKQLSQIFLTYDGHCLDLKMKESIDIQCENQSKAKTLHTKSEAKYTSPSAVLGKKLTAVKISNLPLKFHKNHFVDSFHDQLVKAHIIKENEECIVNCSELSTVDKSVEVEFRSVKEASEICGLVVIYEGKVLSISQNSEKVEIPICPSFAEKKLPTVTISNLPVKFHKNHFVDRFHDQLVEAHIINENEECIVNCSELCAVDKSVEVEFRSVKEASEICGLVVIYEGKVLSISQNSEKVEIPICPSFAEKKLPTVTISNLPVKFHKNHFVDRFHDQLVEAHIINENEECIVNCSELCAVDKSVEVEFRSVKEASEICGLVVIYEGKVLSISQNSEKVEIPICPSFAEKKLPTVTISNLPVKFHKNHFVDRFHDQLVEAHIINENEECIVNCSELCAVDKSVEVEFRSVEEASEICGLVVIYEGKVLSISQNSEKVEIPICPSFAEKKLPTVTISNLPVKFHKNHFVDRFHDQLVEAHIIKENEECIVNCSELCAVDKSVEVEFRSVKEASEICGLVVIYEGKVLSITQNSEMIEVPIAESKLGSVKIDSVSYTTQSNDGASVRKTNLENGEESSDSQTRGTAVSIHNIPPPFIKDFFIQTLNIHMWQKKYIDKGEDATAGCSCYNVKDKSVIVKFTSSELADKFCALKKVEYRGAILQCSRKLSVDVPEDVLLPRAVLVGNVAEPFYKEEFVQLVLSKLWFDEIVVVGKNVITKCIYDSEKSQVVLKFDSPKNAEAACRLKDVIYNGEVLVFEFNTTKSGICSGGGKEPSVTTVESDKGTYLFMTSLLKLRHLFKSGKNHDAALAQIEMILKNKHSITTTISELRNKRRSLLNKYGREKRSNSSSWYLYRPCAVLKGDLDLDALEGTQFEMSDLDSDVEVPQNGLEKYTKGKVWTTQAVRALIHICFLNKADFDKPVRHHAFWGGISAILKDEYNYLYDGDQCSRMMAKNEKEFKNEVDRLSQSGAEGPNASSSWPYFEDMLPLMEGNVAVWPQLTVAAGSSSYVAKAIEGIGGGGSKTVLSRQETSKRNCKSRGPALNWPESAADRRMSILAGALNESNKFKMMLLEHVIKKKDSP